MHRQHQTLGKNWNIKSKKNYFVHKIYALIFDRWKSQIIRDTNVHISLLLQLGIKFV